MNVERVGINQYLILAITNTKGVNLSLDNHQELTLMSQKKLAASVNKQCESPDSHEIKQKEMAACIFVECVYQLNKNFTEQK